MYRGSSIAEITMVPLVGHKEKVILKNEDQRMILEWSNGEERQEGSQELTSRQLSKGGVCIRQYLGAQWNCYEPLKSYQRDVKSQLSPWMHFLLWVWAREDEVTSNCVRPEDWFTVKGNGVTGEYSEAYGQAHVKRIEIYFWIGSLVKVPFWELLVCIY